jgi:hypothetical protein
MANKITDDDLALLGEPSTSLIPSAPFNEAVQETVQSIAGKPRSLAWRRLITTAARSTASAPSYLYLGIALFVIEQERV